MARRLALAGRTRASLVTGAAHPGTRHPLRPGIGARTRTGIDGRHIGIYGSRAVGTQELDAQGRTVRFSLTFDFGQVQRAEERWQRLSVYAESFANYAERYASAS